MDLLADFNNTFTVNNLALKDEPATDGGISAHNSTTLADEGVTNKDYNLVTTYAQNFINTRAIDQSQKACFAASNDNYFCMLGNDLFAGFCCDTEMDLSVGCLADAKTSQFCKKNDTSALTYFQ